ncbi:hypothetical protein CIPAW_05G024000 [Carya illinoinensis]|uniref:Uncharacterized protein n=1 Tax=Carya illinoinensis TaxID=32201 RepID=A0A8T1QEK6_CARIL|nr:hypothetical protein CIPAW_05G024000 [Carya illinoinensis]
MFVKNIPQTILVVFYGILYMYLMDSTRDISSSLLFLFFPYVPVSRGNPPNSSNIFSFFKASFLTKSWYLQNSCDTEVQQIIHTFFSFVNHQGLLIRVPINHM